MFYILTAKIFISIRTTISFLEERIFIIKSRISKFSHNLLNGLNTNLLLNNPTYMLFFTIIFLFLLINNTLGLFSIVFAFSCLPVFCLGLGLLF